MPAPGPEIIQNVYCESCDTYVGVSGGARKVQIWYGNAVQTRLKPDETPIGCWYLDHGAWRFFINPGCILRALRLQLEKNNLSEDNF